ncbi:MAG: glycosyltransferase family 4 protein [Candidatus Aenigmarchaeota archaeon]|nr:glycosyltransferase family 4 protein [Candidatus Aenigmarchaeota archaeon]
MSKKKPKICYLWFEFVEDGCGAVSHMRGFLSGWNDFANFFVISPKKFSYLSEFKDVRCLNLKTRARLFFSTNFLSYPLIKKITSEEKPDLIYCRHVFLTDIGARLALDLKIHFFLEFNGSVVWLTKQWIKSPLKRALAQSLIPVLRYYEMKSLHGATKIFVVSNAMKEQVISLGMPKEKIVVNPNGVDQNKFNSQISGTKIRKKHKIPKNAITVGFIGTFGRWHGAEVLATAARQIIQKRKDIYFLFMGDGYYRENAENAAGESEQIIFSGSVPREQVPEHLAACDILVNPTMPNPDGTEFFGSPTKLFEYMAMGKAIISSNIGQMKEILENNKDALLVTAGNMNSLKNAILVLANNKELRKKLGANARKKVVKEYTWTKNAEKVLEAYKQLQ